MERFDCIVIGPGLGRDSFLMVCLLTWHLPKLIFFFICPFFFPFHWLLVTTVAALELLLTPQTSLYSEFSVPFVLIVLSSAWALNLCQLYSCLCQFNSNPIIQSNLLTFQVIAHMFATIKLLLALDFRWSTTYKFDNVLYL
jgi:hypothetical protein